MITTWSQFMKTFRINPMAQLRVLRNRLLKDHKPLSTDEWSAIVASLKASNVPDVEDRMLASLTINVLENVTDNGS